MPVPTQSKQQWPFSPQAVNNCLLWLDAADESSYTPGASVSTWRNKGYSGGNATTTSGTIGSTTVDINGLSAMSFATGAYMAAPSMTFTQDTRTVFFVLNLGASGSTRIFTNGENNIDMLLFSDYSGTYTDLEMAYPGNQLYQTEAPYPVFDTTSIICGTTLSTNGGIFVNGLSQTPYSIDAPVPYGSGITTTQNIGDVGSESFVLGEILLFDGAITDIQRQQVEGYLAAKWGLQSLLPLTHPYYTPSPPPYNRTFQPVDISGCQLWLDAADQSSMTFSSGTTVSVWNDKSGNGRNATILSGYTGAQFSSTSNALYFPNSTTGYETSYSANPTNETMFVVFNNPSPSGNNNMVIGGPRGARALSGGYSGTTGVGACSYLDNEVTWSGIASMPASTYTSGSTVIITGQVIDSSSSSISQNGGTIYTDYGTTFNYATVNTYIGTDSFYSPPLFYYVGYIMEVIFYNSVLTLPQSQQVEAYLAWKWNLRASLPSTHPGYTLPSFSTVFTPKSLSGLQLWLDAADKSSITFSSGTTVSAWLDKSGNGNNGTANTGITWNVNGFGNGLPAMTFTSTQWFLGNISITGNQFTAFCVFNMNSASTTYVRVLSLGVSGTNDYDNNAYICIVRLGGTVFSNYRNNTYPAINIALDTNELTTSWVDGTTSYISQYGGTPATTGSSGNFGVSSYAIGVSNNTSDSPFYGFISEIIVYNTALTLSQRQQVEGYLAWKWGVQSSMPSTHPFKKFKP